MPPREDLKLVVQYWNRDLQKEHEEGQPVTYVELDEILHHISYRHNVGVRTVTGFINQGSCIPVHLEDLKYYGLDESRYQHEGNILILCHERRKNSENNGLVSEWFVVSWAEITELVQNQRYDDPVPDFPHLQVPR